MIHMYLAYYVNVLAPLPRPQLPEIIREREIGDGKSSEHRDNFFWYQNDVLQPKTIEYATFRTCKRPKHLRLQLVMLKGPRLIPYPDSL
jgi:hypothetical protein